MANKKCKNCQHYICDPDRQDGVTERYCSETCEQTNPNWSCPLWTKDHKKEAARKVVSSYEAIFRTDLEEQL